MLDMTYYDKNAWNKKKYNNIYAMDLNHASSNILCLKEKRCMFMVIT